MTTDLNHNETERPKFLKILCILSFIMCGLLILSHSFSLVFSLVADNLGFDQADKQSVIGQTMNYAANTGANSLKELIVTLVSLAGVFLMWKLKKPGFLVYVLAEVFLYFEFLYVVFVLNVPGVQGIAIEMLWPLPFDIAFIIMYATQLKFMTWEIKARPQEKQYQQAPHSH